MGLGRKHEWRLRRNIVKGGGVGEHGLGVKCMRNNMGSRKKGCAKRLLGSAEGHHKVPFAFGRDACFPFESIVL